MKRTLLFILLTTLILSPMSQAQNSNFKLKDGETVVFLGDSITQAASKPEGYISLIELFCGVNGFEVTAINAGISGNKSDDMLARLDDDVLRHNPDWVSISCGVNDVWHQFKFASPGLLLEDYRVNMIKIVDQCLKSGAKVILNTATPIYEDLDGKENQKLRKYNAFLRELAEEKDLLLSDQFAAFEALIQKKINDERLLTTDGVHMNHRGNRLMARTILESLGMNYRERRQAENRWELVKNMQPMGN